MTDKPISVPLDKVHVQSDGKIVINHPALAEAIKADKAKREAAAGPGDFLDYKCNSGCKP